MSTTWLPCGVYHETYAQDHAWWQTNLIRGKMILLMFILFVVIPFLADSYGLSVCNQIGYTILGALGVQLLIGFCGADHPGTCGFSGRGRIYQHTLDSGVPLAPVDDAMGACLPGQY